jgi:hypothetical protein
MIEELGWFSRFQAKVDLYRMALICPNLLAVGRQGKTPLIVAGNNVLYGSAIQISAMPAGCSNEFIH